jgi:probable F420-dependent oxidoreductase
MSVKDGAPTFGLWYDFRQKLPFAQAYGDFYAECLEEVEEGESLDFSHVWLSEHHFVDDGYLPSPLVMAAAIAARTETMRIGTNVLLLPMHHPLRVAEDAAVVDLISGGRFTLGVGLGYVLHEFETLGFYRKNRPSLLEEGVEVIRRAWTEGKAGYKGRRWRFDDLPFEPRPGRSVPIFFGGYTEPALDRAARMADGFLASSTQADIGETYTTLHERLAAHGRHSEDLPFVASTTIYVHESSDRAWEIASPGIAYQASRYGEWGADGPKPERVRPEDLDRERYHVGAPNDVAERLIQLHERSSYDHLCFWGRLPGVSHEQALASMRLFASEVAPRVQGAVRTS